MAEVTETTRPHTTRSGHGWGYPPVGPKAAVVKIPKITISNPDEEPLPTRWQETVEEQTKETEDLDDEKKPTEPTKTNKDWTFSPYSGFKLYDGTKIHIHRLDEASVNYFFQVALLFGIFGFIINQTLNHIVEGNRTIFP